MNNVLSMDPIVYEHSQIITFEIICDIEYSQYLYMRPVLYPKLNKIFCYNVQ